MTHCRQRDELSESGSNSAKVCIILSNRREWLELVEATETESLATLAQTQQFPWEFAIRLKFLTLYF